MTKLNEIYKCEVCGNIVSVSHSSDGELFCCGKKMSLQIEKMNEMSNEKHLPIVEKKDGGFLVKVGSIEHPMTAEHYIEWIEIIAENKLFRRNLKPNEKPEYFFTLEESVFTVRAYCNLHGLWKNEYGAGSSK